MKSFITTAALAATAVSALDTVSDWDPVLNGETDACKALAVIFARGTFDSGNVGPWVGGPLTDALKAAKPDDVAVQGVRPEDYSADLAGYIEDGGSQSCADGLANNVKSYAEACPDAKIIISGWSQGALCARKSLGSLGDASSRVTALSLFGDPMQVWQDDIEFPATPADTIVNTYCKSNPTDPLCGDASEDAPSDPAGFIDWLKSSWDSFSDADMTEEQKSALVPLAGDLIDQAKDQITKLGKDIVSGHLQRWMLTPEHFMYGMDGSTQTAADDMISAAGL